MPSARAAPVSLWGSAEYQDTQGSIVRFLLRLGNILLPQGEVGANRKHASTTGRLVQPWEQDPWPWAEGCPPSMVKTGSKPTLATDTV